MCIISGGESCFEGLSKQCQEVLVQAGQSEVASRHCPEHRMEVPSSLNKHVKIADYHVPCADLSTGPGSQSHRPYPSDVRTGKQVSKVICQERSWRRNEAAVARNLSHSRWETR